MPGRRSFADVSRRTQIERMRTAAAAALTDYGFEGSRLRLLQHDYNSTFEVTTLGGFRYAMRISLNSPRTLDEVTAEVEWVDAIGSETAVAVPAPVRTVDGRLTTTTRAVGLDRDLPVVVFSWLDGRDIGDRATLKQLAELGRSAARLHDHAVIWTVPDHLVVRSLNRPMMDGGGSLQLAQKTVAAADRQVMDLAADRVSEVLTPLFDQPPHLIHGDLHLWNARWHDNTMSIFDFNDFGLGLAVQDLAISAYYLEPGRRRDAMLAGYESVRSLPPHTAEQFDALLAARNLLLLDDVLGGVTAGYSEFQVTYSARTADRMRHFLDAGVFLHDPPV